MQSRVKMIKPKVKNIINQLFFKLKYTIIYIMVFSFNIYQLKLVLKSIKFSFFTFIRFEIHHVTFVILKRMIIKVKENFQ